jgi:hypothetical protein
MFCLLKWDMGALAPEVSRKKEYVRSGLYVEPATARRAMMGGNWNRDWLKLMVTGDARAVPGGVGVVHVGVRVGQVRVRAMLAVDCSGGHDAAGANQGMVLVDRDATWNLTCWVVAVVEPVWYLCRIKGGVKRAA